MRIKRVVLEHHRDVAVHRLDLVDALIARLDPDRARGDGFQPRNHTQQGRFPAARWADDNDELTVLDVDIDPVDHIRLAKGFS